MSLRSGRKDKPNCICMAWVASMRYHPKKQETRKNYRLLGHQFPSIPISCHCRVSPSYINNRQAPNINAAVPVHTPLYSHRQHTILSLLRPRIQKYSHQPLQRTKLHALHPLPQPRNFLLNPRLRLFNLQLLHIRLLPNPPLLQIQIQPHARLRARYFISKAGV